MSYPKDLDDRQYEIGMWADKTFPFSTPASIIEHLRRELLELAEALDNGGGWALERDECADVAILMLHLAHKEKWSLQREIMRKFEKNKRRRWGQPDALGVVEHIRDEGPARGRRPT